MRKYQDWAGRHIEWDEEVIEKRGEVVLMRIVTDTGLTYYDVKMLPLFSVSHRDEQSARETFAVVVAEQGQVIEAALRRGEEGIGY